jgi:hypothetical protein
MTRDLMDLRAGGKGSRWKLCIGLAIVCGVLVFTAGFLHGNAVASAIDAQQAKSAAYVRGKLTDAVGNEKLTKQLSDRETSSLEKAAEVPAGTVVSIYALDGDPVFSSGRATAGDRSALSSAADGHVSRVISASDLAVYAPIENKGKVFAVAAVVSDIDAVRANGAGLLDALRLPLMALGVVLLIAGLALLMRGRSAPTTPVATDAATPTQKEKKPADAPAKSRVSGFDPAPAMAPAPAVASPARQPEPETAQPAAVPAAAVGAAPAEAAETDAPSRSRMRLRVGRKTSKESVPQAVPDKAAKQPKVKKSLFGRAATTEELSVTTPDPDAPEAMSADRQASILRLLEDQLEQLRRKIQTQEEAAATATRDLQEQLDAAIRRADEAETGTAGPEGSASVGPAERDMIERLRGLEAELSQAKNIAAEAVARADELQRVVDAAPQADPAAPNADVVSSELVEMREQAATAERRAEEAQRLAAEAEQRAASNESVRGELEVRVAQLGAKAGELEQKATELETRLQEANAGGDAVRAEIATLTASLAASRARVEELEAVAGPSVEEHDAATAEVTRLRTELANHMERAQSAEDRVTTLEADVLAAEHGVEKLADETGQDADNEVPPDAVEAPFETESTPTATLPVWVAPSASSPVASDAVSEPEPEPEPATAPVVASASPTVWLAPTATSEESQPEPVAEPGGGEGFSAVFAAAFGTEEDASTPETSQPVSSLPQTPAAVDRYGDVWSEVAPEPETTEQPEQPEPSPAPEVAEEPAAQVTPAVASSLDDEPATESDAMSVDDDLWALRARLAHAADDREDQDAASDGPRWS